ncbi:Concanavalin A-like lectin/glucanases superfamily protein [Fibrobacter sp. UWB8]|uniref:LamG domain-containing protein n=1 Tax=Fibrobacter sp. UWB8 TaxID=1896207 RepID=UPI000921EB7E|nr:LamG domain-containing protein [Fibrobacter sp. UWB8]SHG05048.1 Concanavalin A-like lectin/glucanases superfamily protein [Fibrobacter sp. UWB8]
MDTLFKYASGVALALFAAGLTSCSKSDETAGGVTDIGNSIASGIVVTEANQPVARARVVAYYDNWNKTSIEDSVVVEADDNGIFSLKFDSTRSVVLFAENGSESGLSRIQHTGAALVMVGHPRRLESSVAEAKSGYMRIVGRSEVAPVNSDGSFAFESMPVGEISLVYVASDQSQARFNFMTAVVGDTLKIPSLENKNEGWLTISDYHYYSGAAYGGIMVNVPDGISVPQDTATPEPVAPDTTAKDTSAVDTTEELAISLNLHMDGSDSVAKVYNNDGSVADSVNYVEGVSGKGILLKVGQFVEVGDIDPCAGDFTMSAWTKWSGYRGDGIYQLLFAEREDWVAGLSRFQLQYEFMTSSFVAVGDGMDLSGYGYAWLAKGNVERGGTLPMNEWSLLVLVNEGGKLYFYINGELVSNKAGVPFTPKKVAAPLPFRIGGSEVPNDTWNGAIDEVKIESVARSAEWVKAEYEKYAK